MKEFLKIMFSLFSVLFYLVILVMFLALLGPKMQADSMVTPSGGRAIQNEPYMKKEPRRNRDLTLEQRLDAMHRKLYELQSRLEHLEQTVENERKFHRR